MPIIDLIFIILIFTWAGFVRTGLGFGGAVFTLPLLLLIEGSSIYWLPIIGIHLLLFTFLTVIKAKNIDWKYLKSSLIWIIPGKIIGGFGLLQLPDAIISILVYSITIIYSISYIINYAINSNKKLDLFFLNFGWLCIWHFSYWCPYYSSCLY